jgi:hypothetical protein
MYGMRAIECNARWKLPFVWFYGQFILWLIDGSVGLVVIHRTYLRGDSQ